MKAFVAVVATLVVAAGCGGCGGKKHHAKRAKDATTTTHVVAPPPDAGAVVWGGNGSGSGSAGSGSGSAAPAVVDNGEACTKQPFAESISVPEASGSQLMPIDGVDALVVAGDSGNHGAYEIIDPATGAERESGKLPLGKSKSDDIEGLAARDGKLYGLTSSGFVLTWQRTADKTWELVDGPYALADFSTGLACKEKQVNCGKNYEGVCLRSGKVPDGECVGLAASKTDGVLYCLTEANGRLAAVDRSIPVCGREALTGCDIAPDGSVWAGTNLFGGSEIYRITGWTTPESATVTSIGPYGVGFSESIAVGPGDIIYRFSDLATAPSAVAKFHCPDAGR